MQKKTHTRTKIFTAINKYSRAPKSSLQWIKTHAHKFFTAKKSDTAKKSKQNRPSAATHWTAESRTKVVWHNWPPRLAQLTPQLPLADCRGLYETKKIIKLTARLVFFFFFLCGIILCFFLKLLLLLVDSLENYCTPPLSGGRGIFS